MEILKNFMTYLVTENETKKDSLFFKIYRYDIEESWWRTAAEKIARDINTIILPTKTWNTVMGDFERFLDEKSISWYFKHGIPYKRSYLFYGVPGSGKTSLIQALAAKYDRNLAFVQPSHPKMTDESFKSCIQQAPANSLIVLEDIDALFNKDRSKKNQNCPLTFSGLLNGGYLHCFHFGLSLFPESSCFYVVATSQSHICCCDHIPRTAWNHNIFKPIFQPTFTQNTVPNIFREQFQSTVHFRCIFCFYIFSIFTFQDWMEWVIRTDRSSS